MLLELMGMGVRINKETTEYSPKTRYQTSFWLDFLGKFKDGQFEKIQKFEGVFLKLID